MTTGLISRAGEQSASGILVESDSESELNMSAIPQAGEEEEDSPSDGQGTGRQRDEASPEAAGQDDKKLRPRTNYEGFNIHGWMLCLLVTRKGDKGKARAVAPEPKRQVLMEEWISTQAQGDVGEE